jgi:hypothetical protein
MAPDSPADSKVGGPDEAAAAAAPPPPEAAEAPRGAKRKRGGNATPQAAGVSARSVVNLTPEQLERKRRNDREVRRVSLSSRAPLPDEK